jgi:hypothetical protein
MQLYVSLGESRRRGKWNVERHRVAGVRLAKVVPVLSAGRVVPVVVDVA